MPKSTVFLGVCVGGGGRGGFLTLGKVNGAKIDRFFWEGGEVLDIREGQRCQNRSFFFGKKTKKSSTKNRCQNRPFFRGEGGFRSKSRLYPRLMQRIPQSRICKGRGCFHSSARDPERTICSGLCYQTWRWISLLSTTLRCGSASARSWDVKCQTHLGKWPTCLSRSEGWACGALHN